MARKPAEQRISRRIPIGSPATIRWGEERLSGFVEVVNLAGMYVASSRFPEPGDYVDLIFSLPGNPRNFRVRATVVNTDAGAGEHRPGFGARFERPPLGFLEAIRDLDKGH
ncbi:MAG TPA: PilZ domain-containing protein [Thermoanaerobaculia bacterium]|nr:PilZ domain-containing protein [Thermoanaerobaculia bacterium]